MKVRKGKGCEWPILVMDGTQFVLGVYFGKRKVSAKEKKRWMEALKYGAEKIRCDEAT